MESAASASVSSGVPLLGVLEVRAERVRTRIGFCSLQRDKVKGGRSLRTGIKAIDGAAVAEVADPGRVEVTWQIVAGAVAGVTPFIVAGIEFSKRIVAQRRCGVCGGSGLVKREKYYFRCPRCGGFLPWQSWKRFFSG